MCVNGRRSRRDLEIGVGRSLDSPSFHSVVSLGPMAKERNSTLGPFDVDQRDHDSDPVEAVTEDRADGSVVVPTEDGIEDLPTTVGADGSSLRVSVGQVPYVAGDLVGSWSVASLGDVPSNSLGESLR